MSDRAMMNAQDAVSAHRAECFVTVDGVRYSMLMAKDFEGKVTVNTKEVPRLGNIVIGHKADTAVLAFSMTIYKCTEIFDDIIERFINTGVMPLFTIQTTTRPRPWAAAPRFITTAFWTAMCCCPCSTPRAISWSRA